MTRDRKSRIKALREYAPLFDGRQGEAYRKMKVYVCRCGLKFRESTTFRMHAARRHYMHLPYDTDYIQCFERTEWMSVRVRRKVW